MNVAHHISIVGEADLAELLVLMRAYCDFYEVSPPDEQLLALSRAAIAAPETEGVQLIARSAAGSAAGFASVFWSWDTTEGARVGIMNDLYVDGAYRGLGLADALIAECVSCCERRGAVRLEWQTAPTNERAQAVYSRVGASREPWIDYSLIVRAS